MGSDVVLPAGLADAEPVWANELDEAILAGDSERWPEEAGRFEIVSLELAEWAMRKLAALMRRRNEIRQQAEVWRTPINMWEADELRRVEPAQGFFEGALRVWGMRERRANPKRATFPLPSGTVSTRQVKDAKVVIADENEGAVIEWAAASLSGEEYERVVKTVESVYISKLRELVQIDPIDRTDEEIAAETPIQYQVILRSTGEVVPHVDVELPPAPTVTVEPTL